MKKKALMGTCPCCMKKVYNEDLDDDEADRFVESGLCAKCQQIQRRNEGENERRTLDIFR